MRKQNILKQQISVPTRLMNTALMVAPKEVDRILSALSSGCDDTWEYDEAENPFEIETDYVCVIPVFGGIVYRGHGWYWQESYPNIRSQFMDAIDNPSVKTIVFDIDSCGGEVAGCFDLVDAIYNARGTKPIYAIANQNAMSAAYAIASAADKVFLSRTASVGSVGVIAIHADQSKLEQDIGIKYTAVFAGDHKNDFTPHEPLTNTARERLQESVNSFYDLFVNTVARNRGLSVESVRGTNALTYDGDKAVAVGFADAVLTWEELAKNIINEIGGMSMKIEELRDGLNTLLASSPDLVHVVLENAGFVQKTQAVKWQNDAQNAGIDEAMKIASETIDLCAAAEMPEMAKGMIESKMTIDQVRSKLLEAKASNKEEIISTVGAVSTGEINPLLMDAKRRAESK